MSNFRSLWWGQGGVDVIKLSLDGAADSPTETLQFSTADSNPGAGIAVFTGSSTLDVRTGVSVTTDSITISGSSRIAADVEVLLLITAIVT